MIKQWLKSILQLKILPIFYNTSLNKDVDKNKVIFADAHNNSIPYSMVALHEKFQNEGYYIEDFFLDYNHSSPFKIMREMIKFMRSYATAKYVIICDYYLPASSANKRADTKVIQIWHACGAFKKTGYDADDDISESYKGSPTKNFDLVAVTSPYCIKPLASAFRLSEKHIEPLGSCRTDCLFDEKYIQSCKDKFYTEYPKAKGKKLVMWAPTFRGNAGNPSVIGEETIRELQSKLGEEWFVIIKPHPHLKNIKSNCTLPTEELLPVVDVMISDYSSVIFEYLLFDKALVLLVPDFDEYHSDRGFYLNYSEIPGSIVKEANNLPDAIIKSLNNIDKDKAIRFREKYLSACDGHSTERIFNRIVHL
ncbi:MAG: CDP-glycerol glycerophosphotransferase family protein [Ruminococcus sp.]|nr:CDP-glycerol glycerophosphotransferase family protein [Ruminococcus sp.]